jgi:hypothetical protein
MIHASLRPALRVLAVALACIRLQANDYFVAPGGSPFGPGTLSAPYDLATALSGQVGLPGDTFWLRGGDYKLGHMDTSIQGAPGLPVTFRQVSGENASIDGSISVFDSMGYVVFRDFELYSSDTNRVSAQTNAGFNVTDISIIPGVSCYAPNLSLINLVVHDQTRHGIYTAQNSSNTLVYGCILFNNGWSSPDNAEGHGIYAQGSVGNRTLTDNIVFNNSGANMHVYEDTPDESLVGFTLDGNVAFNASGIQTVRPYRDWIVGVDSPALYADNIVLRNNMGYRLPDLSTQTEAQIGRDSINGSLVVTDNYLPLGLLMNNWRTATVSGNLLLPRLRSSYVLGLTQTLTPLSADWDNNTYVWPSGGNEVLLDFQPCSFSEWQAATGFDWGSTFLVGDLHGTRVFVRTNLYEGGRASIVVYNWDNLDKVTVNVSSLLPVGSGFEVRNAQNFHAPPVLSGVFDGRPLQLAMTNLTVASPNGPLLTPPSTGPTFGVFVLLPQGDRLQITLSNRLVHVDWPLSAGTNGLQYTFTPATAGSWTNSSDRPVVVGDRFVVTERLLARAKFFRLHTVLPRPGALQIRYAGGSVQVSWPGSFGANALQSNGSLANVGGWTQSTNTPVVAGDQFMITEPASAGGKFYRLRTGP